MISLAGWAQFERVGERSRGGLCSTLQHSIQLSNNLHLLGRVGLLHGFEAKLSPCLLLLVGHSNSCLAAKHETEKSEFSLDEISYRIAAIAGRGHCSYPGTGINLVTGQVLERDRGEPGEVDASLDAGQRAMKNVQWQLSPVAASAL